MADRKTILIIDDELRMLESLQTLLGERGYRVLTSEGPQEAIACLNSSTPDVILLDIVMPGMNGFQVMNYMRKQSIDIPVIIMTGYASTESAVEAFRKGAVDYFKKPFDIDAVCSSVEKALRQNKQESKVQEDPKAFRALAEHANVGLMIIQAGSVVFANHALEVMSGYGMEELYSMQLLELQDRVHREDRPKLWEHYLDCLKGESLYEPCPFRVISRNGAVSLMEMTASTIEYNDKPAILAVCRHVDNLKLKGQGDIGGGIGGENKYSRYIEKADCIILIRDNTDRIIFVNEFTCQYFGFSKEMIIGKRAGETVFKSIDDIPGNIQRKNFAQISQKSHICKYRMRNGGLVWIAWMNNLIHDEQTGTMEIMSIGTDISEVMLKRERDLHNLRRKTAISPAGLVAGSQERIKRVESNVSLMTEGPLNKSLKRISDIRGYTAEGSFDASRPLMEPGRGEQPKRTVDLGRILINQVQLLSRTQEQVRIHMNYDKTLWHAKGDEDQISQVFLDFFLVLSRSLPMGGDLWVRVKNLMLKNRKNREGVHHKYVKISIRGRGEGIDEKRRKSLTDGLLSAQSIIRQNGGFLRITKGEGKDTTYHILLPASEPRESALSQRETEPPVVSGVVLLMDPEEKALATIKQMLETIGYRVLLAEDGKEAMDLFMDVKGDLDVVMMDAAMKEVRANELYLHIKSINPKVKVFFTAGGHGDANQIKLSSLKCDGFMQKPFDIESLAEKMKKAFS